MLVAGLPPRKINQPHIGSCAGRREWRRMQDSGDDRLVGDGRIFEDLFYPVFFGKDVICKSFRYAEPLGTALEIHIPVLSDAKIEGKELGYLIQVLDGMLSHLLGKESTASVSSEGMSGRIPKFHEFLPLVTAEKVVNIILGLYGEVIPRQQMKKVVSTRFKCCPKEYEFRLHYAEPAPVDFYRFRDELQRRMFADILEIFRAEARGRLVNVDIDVIERMVKQGQKPLELTER